MKETVVIGLPHETDGELPTGVVVLKENKECAQEELLKFVESKCIIFAVVWKCTIFFVGQVSDYKKLRGGIRFVKKIPLTPTGKLKRRDIRDLLVKNII